MARKQMPVETHGPSVRDVSNVIAETLERTGIGSELLVFPSGVANSGVIFLGRVEEKEFSWELLDEYAEELEENEEGRIDREFKELGIALDKDLRNMFQQWDKYIQAQEEMAVLEDDEAPEAYAAYLASVTLKDTLADHEYGSIPTCGGHK